MHIKNDRDFGEINHVDMKCPKHNSESLEHEKPIYKEEHVMPVHQDAATGDGLGPRQDELGHLEKMAKE